MWHERYRRALGRSTKLVRSRRRGLSLLAIAAMYLLAVFRGVPPRQFAGAVAPAQGIAVSARSSLAAHRNVTGAMAAAVVLDPPE